MEEFVITQRQYDIIMRQALENYPQESGGFLGGKRNQITGVLPAFNKHLYDKTIAFAIDSDDLTRAHAFFAKHQLDFLGIYHSHPTGLPSPSREDLKTGQKYHFIIGLRDINNPEFGAFLAKGMVATAILLRVISNQGVTVIELDPEKKYLAQGDLFNEAQRLSDMIADIWNEKMQYPKLQPDDYFEDTNFSTIA